MILVSSFYCIFGWKCSIDVLVRCISSVFHSIQFIGLLYFRTCHAMFLVSSSDARFLIFVPAASPKKSNFLNDIFLSLMALCA